VITSALGVLRVGLTEITYNTNARFNTTNAFTFLTLQKLYQYK
jgi:hypothetical protein